MLPFLATFDRGFACTLLNDTIASYRSHGINEWIGPFYPATTHGAAGFVSNFIVSMWDCVVVADNSNVLVGMLLPLLARTLHLNTCNAGNNAKRTQNYFVSTHVKVHGWPRLDPGLFCYGFGLFQIFV